MLFDEVVWVLGFGVDIDVRRRGRNRRRDCGSGWNYTNRYDGDCTYN